jgi:hypothetical protein
MVPAFQTAGTSLLFYWLVLSQVLPAGETQVLHLEIESQCHLPSESNRKTKGHHLLWKIPHCHISLTFSSWKSCAPSCKKWCEKERLNYYPRDLDFPVAFSSGWVILRQNLISCYFWAEMTSSPDKGKKINFWGKLFFFGGNLCCSLSFHQWTKVSISAQNIAFLHFISQGIKEEWFSFLVFN